MSDYSIVPNAALTATADAIRTKSGSQATIEFDHDTGFKDAVDAIPTTNTTWEDALVSGTWPSTDYINNRVTEINSSAFQAVPANTRVSLPNVTTIGSNSSWNGGTARDNMKKLYLPKLTTLNVGISYRNYIDSMYFPMLTSLNTERLRYWRRLVADIVLPSLTTLAGIGPLGNEGDLNDGTAVNIYLPALTTLTSSNTFDTCINTELIDMGSANKIGSNCFIKCYRLQTIILRKSDAIAPLDNVNAFSNTPFSGYNSLSGTVYIPKVLYDHLGDGTSLDYRAATNWATMYADGHLDFAKIEGSAYENLNYTDLMAPAKTLAESWL